MERMMICFFWSSLIICSFVFFFQAEDGIRDHCVTGVQTCALPIWYFQRYAAHLPSAGEMVLFDRSWYNRAGVEHVMGFCTEAEYEEFLRFCPSFEQALQNDGIMLVKYWLSVSDEEQERRFKKRLSDPRKRWKFSPIDLQARARWVDYAEAKDRMFARKIGRASCRERV